MAKTGDLQSDPDNMTINLELRHGNVHRNSAETNQTISFESYNLSLPMTGSSPVHYERMNFTTRATMTPQSDSIVAGDPRSYHESAVTARGMVEIGPLPDS